jgi:hypothetical protein
MNPPHSESWITVSSRDDLADAEWEAAALVEAGIAAEVFEPEEFGELEVRVERENVERALQTLAAFGSAESAEALESEREGVESRPLSTFAANERQSDFEAAYVCGALGFLLLPLGIYALRRIIKGWRRPEPMSLREYFVAIPATVVTVIGLLFGSWFLIAIVAR